MEANAPGRAGSGTSAWSPLRIRIYRAFLLSAIAAHTGNWMYEVSAAWLMTGIAPSPMFVPLVQTAVSLPMFLMALPGGALADILDRRRLLLGSFAVLALLLVCLGLSTLFGWVNAWILLAFIFAIGVVNGFARPALDALTPEAVPSEELPQAVSLDAVGFNVARALGGAAGGLLMAVLGSGGVFILGAACNLPYAASLFGWKRTVVRRSLPPESVLGAVKAGLRYVRFAREPRGVLVRVAGFILAGSALWSLLPLIARDQMKLSSGEYGLLVGVFGLGALAAAAILPPLRARSGAETIVAAATILLSGVLVSLAFSRAFVAVAVTMLGAGAAWLALMSTLNAALQASVPSWVRARASALYELTFMGGTAAGSTLWGILATARDARFALISAATLAATSLLLALRFGLPKTKLVLAPSLHWPDPSLASHAGGKDGPVEVSVEYRIDPAHESEFRREMAPLGEIRRRDGATDWRLEVDPGDPGHYIEVFRLDSWAEHLRQHERVTVADRERENAARAFHRGSVPPVVTHRRLGN